MSDAQLELFFPKIDLGLRPAVICHRCRGSWPVLVPILPKDAAGQTYAVCPYCGAVVAR